MADMYSISSIDIFKCNFKGALFGLDYVVSNYL